MDFDGGPQFCVFDKVIINFHANIFKS